MKGLTITSLQHIGIPVSDIRISEKFYASLGFTNVMEAPFNHPEGEGICIMMQHGSILIELYQLPGKSLEEIRIRKDGHIDHIAFDVPDIDLTFSILKKNGYAILEESPVYLKFWKNGCWYFNLKGPDGERLEFNQVV